MAGSDSSFKDIDLVQMIASANSQFGLDLYKKLATEKEDNIFLSPFSISAALGMTHLGARGDTASQMNQALKWTDIQDTVHPGFEDYLSLLMKKQESYVLTTANRLFISNKHKILGEFLTKTDQHYGASAVLADFVGNGSGEIDKINKWVEGETNNKIKDLISGGIDPMTAMIIVNAIYFKGNWAKQFDPAETTKGLFKVKQGETVEVDMMRMEKSFNFARNDKLKCSILELPYVDEDISMFFFLPFEDDGLASLEQTLDHELLNEALDYIGRDIVDITLPRFVLESSFILNDVLKALGMTDAFEETKADLSGIDGSRQLYISEVVHKAFLEVNEKGSEAAAATSLRAMALCIPKIEPFKADHPFLFLIRDNRTDVVLFLGRLLRPDVAVGKQQQ